MIRNERSIAAKHWNMKTYRSNCLEIFLGKGVLKIDSKFTEHPCRSVISIKLERTTFPKNTSGGLLLNLGLLF